MLVPEAKAGDEHGKLKHCKILIGAVTKIKIKA